MKDLMVPIKRTTICENCRGNGYLNVIDNKGLTQVKQRFKKRDFIKSSCKTILR